MAANTTTQVNPFEAEARLRKATAIYAEIPSFISAETLNLMTQEMWNDLAAQAGQHKPSAATIAMVISMAESHDKAQAKFAGDAFAGFPGN